MKIRLAASLQADSIVDGEGIRTVIWTQGCPHHCPGCHNPDTHDFLDGKEFDVEEIMAELDKLEDQDGLTFSGGDPFVQPGACYAIAKYAKSKDWNIWCYTGYLFEDLIKLSRTNRDITNFLNYIDVLVDGKFVLAKRSFSTAYRGSTNQRIIDVKKSLKAGHVITIDKYDHKEEMRTKPKPVGLYL